MPERARTRQGPIAPPDTTLSVVLSVGLLSASLLWAWYALIYSPTLGIEHDRALTGNLVQGLTVELQSVDRYDESRARNLVVAMQRELPKIRRLDGLDSGPLEVRLQSLEDSLRLGTYDPAIHRAALNELRDVQLQLIARSQRTATAATQSSQRVNLMFVAMLAAAFATLWRMLMRPGHGGIISVLGREQLGQLLFDVSPEAVSIADPKERILAVNPAFCRVTGYDVGEVVGRTLNFNGSGEQDEGFFEAMRADLAEAGKWTGEIWQRRKTGEAYAEKVTRVRIDDESGRACGYLTVSMDLSANKDAERLINWQAHHDTLTKLPNRTLLLERLTRVLVHRRNRSEPGALLSIDIDRFKMVNDSIGPKLGDRLLIEAAMRVAMAARESDTVARLGSDEFAVMLPDLSDYAEAERMARSIQASLLQPFRFEGHEIVVTSSIGIALYPEDGTDPGKVMQRSNTAMARAKELGGNAIVFYESDMNVRAERRLLLETELRRAAREHQLVLHYQPIVDLRTMRVVGAEALMRWAHPERGMISPADFIPIAEETGLIIDMGCWLVDEVGAQIERWNDPAMAHLRFSINVSARQLQHPNDIQALIEHIRSVSANRMSVEITESVLMADHAAVLSFLEELRALGVHVALDDFGTGFSSLSYLRKFHFDVLKVDRSFIRDVERSNTDLGLVASIVSMGRILGVEVVAEGVESDAQLQRLQQVGCDLIQGYFFSKPLPAPEFAAFARTFGCGNEGTSQ
jgi:diguanylate cyclase (GGDEF)-like protein/PAS domain S-box-containing protein